MLFWIIIIHKLYICDIMIIIGLQFNYDQRLIVGLEMILLSAFTHF